MSQKTTLKQWVILAYGVSTQFLNTFLLMFLAYYMLFYLTNVWGVPALAAAGIYGAAMWLKTGTMVVAGAVVDSTSLKWGKYRSWAYIGAVLCLIGTTLTFTKFGIANQVVTAVLFLVVYTLSTYGYNSLWVAQRAMLGKMSKNKNDTIALTSSAQMFSSLGGIIYGLVGAKILTMWGNEQLGYTYTAMLYSLIIVIGSVIFAAITKKYDPPVQNTSAAAEEKKGKKERIGMIYMLKNLKGPMVPYFIAMTLGNAQLGFFFALLAYYTKFVLKDPAAFGLSITLSSVFAVVGAYAAQPLCKKYSKKAVWLFVMVITGILYGLVSFIGKTSVPFLILRSAIGFAGSFIGVLLPAMANDIADNTEMKGEKGARAFVQAMAGTTVKFGSVVSAMAASFGLAFIGYNKGVELTPKMLSGITNLMAFGPALVCLLSALVFVFYNVDESALDAFRSAKNNNAEAKVS